MFTYSSKCSVMLHRCVFVSQHISKSVRLNALPSATCVRQYAMTYDEEEREKKIKARAIKVNLIMPDQKVSSMTLEQAQKLAKRRNFQMTRLHDPPKFASFGGRDVYEMVTKSMHVKLSAESSQSEDVDNDFKDKKTITFSSKIAEHDMQIKLKQIKKLLLKHHEVIVIVADDSGDTLKEKVALVESECKDLTQNITTVNKKKQAVLTLKPQLVQTKDKSEQHGDSKAKSKNQPTSGNSNLKSKQEPATASNTQ